MKGINSFDAVITCMAYHHFSNKKGFACEAERVLKPDGVLYIVDPYFPWIICKAMNCMMRLFRVVGEFNSPREIETMFAVHGFVGTGAVVDAYAQVIKLQMNGHHKGGPNLQA